MTGDEIRAAAEDAYLEQDLLAGLNDAGEDSGSDYHDGMDGLFGWTVKVEGTNTQLWLSFTPVVDDVDYEDTPAFVEKFRLVRLGGAA